MAAIRGASILFNSSASFALNSPSTFGSSTGSSIGPSIPWVGGRTAFNVSAQNYGFGLMCQVQMPDSSWMQIGSSVLANYIINPTQFVFDAAPGQYRIVISSGSSAGLNAMLVGIDYGV